MLSTPLGLVDLSVLVQVAQKILVKMQTFKLSVIALLSFSSTPCLSSAIPSKNSNKTTNGTGNSSEIFSRRQGFVALPHHQLFYPQVPNNLYYTTPGVFQSAIGAGSTNGFQLQSDSTKISDVSKLKAQAEKKKQKEENDENTVEETTKSSKKKKHRRKNKEPNEGESTGKVESKGVLISDEGTERGCPACISGTCDATLDPSTNISGIPVIQIIIACAVGAFWAGIFIFFLLNFIEHDKEDGGGGYSPTTSQYGAPVSSYSYGAPASEYGTPSAGYSQTGYNTNRVAYNRYGRAASSGFFPDQISTWVLHALEKLANLYDDDKY